MNEKKTFEFTWIFTFVNKSDVGLVCGNVGTSIPSEVTPVYNKIAAMPDEIPEPDEVAH